MSPELRANFERMLRPAPAAAPKKNAPKIVGTANLAAEDGTVITVNVVAPEACPHCHEEGRPKIWDAQNVCWWKCYNPACNVGFYQPESGRVELK
jgi:hypothetical protein